MCFPEGGLLSPFRFPFVGIAFIKNSSFQYSVSCLTMRSDKRFGLKGLGQAKITPVHSPVIREASKNIFILKFDWQLVLYLVEDAIVRWSAEKL